MSELYTIETSDYCIRLEGDVGAFNISMSSQKECSGLEFVRVAFDADEPAMLHDVRLVWEHAHINTHNVWHSGVGAGRSIGPNWGPARCYSRGTSHAPVMVLHDISGKNTLTFALSDCLNSTMLSAGVSEETAMTECKVQLFSDPMPGVKHYEVVLRLDTRPLPYYEALKQVSEWWASMPGQKPAKVPEHARLPLYSTWYSFHQKMNPEELENQCKIAKTLGMESIIVDDGWQTDDNSRGYAYCGDWEVAENKFPDFRAHIARVHELGMKYVLWFSVPLIGIHTKAYERFRDKVLDPDSGEWFVLDPRFPEVRDYLIGIYEDFVRRYDVDGFKLDFVDSFKARDKTRDLSGDGRDFLSVPKAVDQLLSDALIRLKALKPDILIEFRQTYIGPLMRKYGNMLRAIDVPDNFAGNRLHTIDIRLLSGDTPAHSDMVMWHPDEPVESAAMQLIHSLFSVPQVSVLLDKVPKEHLDMLRFLLSFWRNNRDVLLDGEFIPVAPEMLYPVVYARTPDKLIAACYSSSVRVSVDKAVSDSVILVNGSYDDKIVIESACNVGQCDLRVYRCTGELVHVDKMEFGKGLHSVAVPPAGIAFLDF